MDDEGSNADDKRFVQFRFLLVSAFLFRIVGVTRKGVGRVEGKMLQLPLGVN